MSDPDRDAPDDEQEPETEPRLGVRRGGTPPVHVERAVNAPPETR